MKEKQGGWGTLWIAARCGANSPVAERLIADYGAQLTPAVEVHAEIADFLFMAASTRLIMSQSTFSW